MLYERHTFDYNGKEHSLNELAKISGLHRDTILRRLEMGWTMEEILATPAGASLVKISSEDCGKQIPVMFNAPLPVYDAFQPTLGKKYIATICGTKNKKMLARIFFVIELENGKRLITYPGECEQIEEEAASC